MLGTSRARAALLGQRQADEGERIAAIDLLVHASESASPQTTFLAALDREQAPRVRAALLVALARRGRSESVPALVAVHRRGDDVERGLALRALAELDSDVAVRELALGLASAEDVTSAVPALVRAGARAVPLVLHALRDAPTTTAAATALGPLGDPRATAPLVGVLGSPREDERVMALEALAVLDDARASDAVAARLADDSPRVVRAALAALAVLGDASHAAAILPLARTGSHEQRRAALTALVAAEPVAGAAEVAAALDGGSAELVGAARALLLEARDPAFSPLLEGRVPGDPQPEALAGALASLDGGAGIGPLVRLAAAGPAPLRRAVAGALAVALRTWHAERSERELKGARATLADACASLPAGEALVLRAIAGDLGTVPAIRVALRDREQTPNAAARRAGAGLAAEALGARELAPFVLGALAVERDPEAFRRLADAARALGAEAPLGPLLARARDPETGPEALLLAATSLSTATPEERRQFAVLARACLRAADERLSSNAARALALAHDVRGARALLSTVREALRDDAAHEQSPRTAMAAAHALAALPAPASFAAELAAEARACADPQLRAALLDASAAAQQRRAQPLDARGDQVLHVRFVLAGGSREDGVSVDVRLADGRILRRRTLPGGDLFVLDLAAGDADVTLRAEADRGP